MEIHSEDAEAIEAVDPVAEQANNDPINPRQAPFAPNALPSVLARLMAFCSIVIGGSITAYTGWIFADLQGGKEGSSTYAKTVGALGFGVIGTVGTAVVAVLALRAINEWKRH